MTGFCWDCGKRKGTVPAIEDKRTPPNVYIIKICTLCANRWRRFLKGGGPQSSVFKTVVS